MHTVALRCVENNNSKMFSYIIKFLTPIELRKLLYECVTTSKHDFIDVIIQSTNIEPYNVALFCLVTYATPTLEIFLSKYQLNDRELNELARLSLRSNDSYLINLLSKYVTDYERYAICALCNRKFKLFKSIEDRVNIDLIMQYAETRNISAESMIVLINRYELWKEKKEKKRRKRSNSTRCLLS